MNRVLNEQSRDPMMQKIPQVCCESLTSVRRTMITVYVKQKMNTFWVFKKQDFHTWLDWHYYLEPLFYLKSSPAVTCSSPFL